MPRLRQVERTHAAWEHTEKIHGIGGREMGRIISSGSSLTLDTGAGDAASLRFLAGASSERARFLSPLCLSLLSDCDAKAKPTQDASAYIHIRTRAHVAAAQRMCMRSKA